MNSFENWIKGFESIMEGTYTERELWLMKWCYKTGASKGQPIGTYVTLETLIPEAVYEVMELDMIVSTGKDGALFVPTAEGLKAVTDDALSKFNSCTFLRLK